MKLSKEREHESCCRRCSELALLNSGPGEGHADVLVLGFISCSTSTQFQVGLSEPWGLYLGPWWVGEGWWREGMKLTLPSLDAALMLAQETAP